MLNSNHRRKLKFLCYNMENLMQFLTLKLEQVVGKQDKQVLINKYHVLIDGGKLLQQKLEWLCLVSYIT